MDGFRGKKYEIEPVLNGSCFEMRTLAARSVARGLFASSSASAPVAIVSEFVTNGPSDGEAYSAFIRLRMGGSHTAAFPVVLCVRFLCGSGRGCGISVVSKLRNVALFRKVSFCYRMGCDE